jgi:hypothetical protein
VTSPRRRIERRLVAWVVATFTVIGSAPAVARAQGTTISGRVVDEAGRAVVNAHVELAAHRTGPVRTDTAGAFTFIGAERGSHRLLIRQLGFQPVDTLVDTPGPALLIRLRRTSTTLSRVMIRANRQGIYGTVARATTLAPLAQARVRIVGVERVLLTDSLGMFAAELSRPGSYVLRFEQDGYAARSLSIEVARNEAREVLIALEATDRDDARNQILWREFDSRTRMRGLNAALVPSTELSAAGTTQLSHALAGSKSFAVKNLKLSPDACIYVDGEPRPGSSLDAFDVDDILAVEVFGRRGDLTATLAARWPKGVRCGTGMSFVPWRVSDAEAKLQVQAVVIWLKK